MYSKCFLIAASCPRRASAAAGARRAHEQTEEGEHEADDEFTAFFFRGRRPVGRRGQRRGGRWPQTQARLEMREALIKPLPSLQEENHH